MAIDAGIVGTAGLLALMSVISWALIIRQWLALRWMRRQLEALDAGLAGTQDLEALSTRLSGDDKAVCRRILEAAQGLGTPGGNYLQLDSQDRRDIALRSVLRSLEQLMGRGLVWLASIASTAPFVGLFGTVWGIFAALNEIADASEASIQTVAQPMGEALLMTAAGIAVALPAVIAFNRFSRARKDLTQDLWAVAEDLRQIVIASASEPTGRPA